MPPLTNRSNRITHGVIDARVLEKSFETAPRFSTVKSVSCRAAKRTTNFRKESAVLCVNVKASRDFFTSAGLRAVYSARVRSFQPEHSGIGLLLISRSYFLRTSSVPFYVVNVIVFF